MDHRTVLAGQIRFADSLAAGQWAVYSRLGYNSPAAGIAVGIAVVGTAVVGTAVVDIAAVGTAAVDIAAVDIAAGHNSYKGSWDTARRGHPYRAMQRRFWRTYGYRR